MPKPKKALTEDQKRRKKILEERYKGFSVVTAQFPLNVRGATAEERKANVKELWAVCRDLQRARNEASRSAFVFYQHLHIFHCSPTVNESPVSDCEAYVNAMYQYSRSRKPYQHAPASLIYRANRAVAQHFKAHYREILSGQRSVPRFSDRDLTCAVQAEYLQFHDLLDPTKEEVKYGNLYGLRVGAGLFTKGLTFTLRAFGKDKGLEHVFNNIRSGAFKMLDSRLVYHPDANEKKKSHWRLHLTYKFPTPKVDSVNGRVCGVDLGWVVPAYCALSDNSSRISLGSKKDILRFRNQMKNRRQSLQKDRNFLSKGHGKKKAMQAHEKLLDKESKSAQYYNHLISSRVVKFCLREGAGTIHMEHLTSQVKKGKFLTAYWSYYALQTMIEYKAKQAGIEVKYVNPAYTSQECPQCHYQGEKHNENRPRRGWFHCAQCGHEGHADYIAALNISRSTNFFITEDDVDDSETDFDQDKKAKKGKKKKSSKAA